MQLGDTAPIFCETFDSKNPGIASRSGDLDPNVWGVSRAYRRWRELRQQQYNNWASTLDPEVRRHDTACHAAERCHHLQRSTSAGIERYWSGHSMLGRVTVMALYPKQPFDFAGRTGTVSFDVSNDTHGTHAAWPEFWLTDLPIPTPFNHFDSVAGASAARLRHSLRRGCRSGNVGMCQNLNNFDKWRWTVDSAVVIRNYVMDDTKGFGIRTSMQVTAARLRDRVSRTERPAQSRRAQDFAEPDRRVGLRRWLDGAEEDCRHHQRQPYSHARADLAPGRSLQRRQGLTASESSPSQREHTYTWDNVAFDGPFTYRDFSYDALDNNAPGRTAR